jgi:DNA repair exonuclease SbcCD ATPase subunit
MRTRLERRLAELRREYDAGQQALADLERQQAQLRDTMLRISGAVQVLEEELARADAAPVGDAPDPAAPEPVPAAASDGAGPGRG